MDRFDTKIDPWIDHCGNLLAQDQETWKALPWFFAIALLFYFSALSFFSISIDSELAAFRVHSGVWISQGRWTSYLIETFLFPKIVLPFMPIAVFCFAASLAYVFMLIAHNMKAGYITYLAFPFFCAFPIWRIIGAFSANLPSLAWGLLACGIAAWLFKKISVTWAAGQMASPLSCQLVVGIFMQALLVATAVGAYQSYILVFSCFGLGIVIRTILSDTHTDLKIIARMLALLAVTTVLGLLVYALIECLLLYLLNIKISYIQNFYNPAQVVEAPLHVIFATVSQAARVYAGGAELFGAPLTGVFIIMLLGLYSVGSSTCRLSVWILVAIILITPFMLTFVSGSRVPLRILIAVPYVIWLFAVLALEHRSRLIKLLSSAAIIVSLFQILYISSQQAAVKQITQQQDFAMAALIYDRIASVNPDFDSNKIIRVDFFGGKQMDNPLYSTGKGSTAGASFFGWGGGFAKRMIAFMRLIGYNNLEILNKEDRLALTPHYHSMPSWPAPGSVKRIGDITLVKLGDVPGQYDDAYLKSGH